VLAAGAAAPWSVAAGLGLELTRRERHETHARHVRDPSPTREMNG
jgi:hypothetical protein